jgi:glucose-1-phosphate thymidylyltransferase
MVFYPIQTLVNAGVKEILMVVGGPYAGHFVRVLKNGKELGIKHLEFAYQENEGGIAEALGLAEDFSDSDPICVILGDNCTDADIKRDVKNFKEGAYVFLKKVPDPHRFGVPSFNKNKGIRKISEKPKRPASNYAVTGLYMYDSTVFNKIRKLKPSKRGELEITDINNAYIKEGTLNHGVLRGYWRDAGTFDTLYEANKYWVAKALKK